MILKDPGTRKVWSRSGVRVEVASPLAVCLRRRDAGGEPRRSRDSDNGDARITERAGERERESGVGRGCFTSTRMEMERGKLGHGTLAFDDAKQGFYTQSRDSKGQVFYGQR